MTDRNPDVHCVKCRRYMYSEYVSDTLRHDHKPPTEAERTCKACKPKKAKLQDHTKDIERLDWLDKARATVYSSNGGRHWVVVDERCRHEDRRGCIGNTLRDAIDSAMAKSLSGRDSA